MAKKSIVNATLIIIIGISLIILIPIQIISIKLSSYDIINESYSFIYNPSMPSSFDSLYINIDEGDVDIRYVDPPFDYYVLIDVNIVLVGEKLKEKSYNDFLNISWNNSSSPLNFRMDIISEDWFNALFWLVKDINIVVNLRKDIIFDVKTIITEGNFGILVPWTVSIGNLFTNVSNGNISYDFEYSSIHGNISGNINEGDLTFKVTNVEYAFNNSWNINIGKGSIYCEIYQDQDMGANITSLVKVNHGDVFIHYEDHNINIGAILEIPYGGPFLDVNGIPWCIRSSLNLTCTEVEGFDYDMLESEEGIVYFISFDLLANIIKNYYSMRFEIIEGSFAMNLLSEP